MARRDALKLRAALPEFKRRVVEAQRLIERMLEVASAPYVALSGGKDSTVVRDLVCRQTPDTPCIYVDDEWRLPETDAYLSAIPNLRRVAKRGEHAEWFTAWDEKKPSDAEWLGDDYRPDWARATLGYDGCFLGLRIEENTRRRLYLRRYGPLHFNQRRDAWQCSPIAKWSTADVWTYILSRDIPCNTAYDVLERIGVPLEEQRIGPFAVERALGYGQLAILKRGWPDLFNRFAEKYPEARSYV